MTMPRLVVPGQEPENTLNISANELQRMLTVIVNKNPKAILIMLETNDGLEWVTAPDSDFLAQGMIDAAYRSLEAHVPGRDHD
jgi:hypothetical protein